MKEILIKMLENIPETGMGKICGKMQIYCDDACRSCPFDSKENLKKLIEELKQENK